jgi:alanine racemase
LQLPSSKTKSDKKLRELHAPFFSAQSLTRVEISKSALLHNIRQYKNAVPQGTLLAPVIKSNAYGHGLKEVASILNQTDLVDYICVVSLSEALLLRKQKITKPLLVLSILDSPLEQALLNNIDVVVHDSYSLKFIIKAVTKTQSKAHIHIKIDTGLSRLGIHYTQALEFIEKCSKTPGIKIQGIFSHYVDAEDTNPLICPVQQTRFNAIIKKFDKIPYKHFSCSAALSSFDTAYTFGRFGIGLYGLWPSERNKEKTISLYPQFSLQPVMQWKTSIISIKTIPAQSVVGYDATFSTTQEIKTAVLPVGYWDGYDRELSNCGVVKIHDQFASVLGRVAMNLTVVDITSIPNVCVQDEVTLLGYEDSVNAKTIATHCNTINYEIVTRINPSLERIIIE